MLGIRSLTFAMIFTLVVAGNVFGQTGIAPAPLRPNAKPTVSPFLFLGDGRFPAALNYYQRVRPQRELLQRTQSQFRDLRELDREITTLRQREDSRIRGELPSTGHRSYFFSPGTYFQSTGRYYDREVYQTRPTTAR